jgi:hypothetical protein
VGELVPHRKFTHAAVGIAMAAATFRFMQATAKTAMRRVLGIRGRQGETLVPPTAVAGGDEGFVFEFEASTTPQQLTTSNYAVLW